MSIGQLTVTLRKEIGKSPTRKLRFSGSIPGICYGVGSEPISISLNTKALQAALDPIKGRNTLLKMRIEGMAQGSREVSVLVKDVQTHALKGIPVHADFMLVALDRPVRVTVPVQFNGKSRGVADGGNLHLEYRKLPLLCLPDQIPAHIAVDVSPLGMGDSIHISDITWPTGVTPALSPETTLCVVTAPREEKAASATAAGAEGSAVADAGKKAAGEAAGAKDDKAKAAPKGK